MSQGLPGAGRVKSKPLSHLFPPLEPHRAPPPLPAPLQGPCPALGTMGKLCLKRQHTLFLLKLNVAVAGVGGNVVGAASDTGMKCTPLPKPLDSFVVCTNSFLPACLFGTSAFSSYYTECTLSVEG